MYEIHIGVKKSPKYMTIPGLCDKIKTLVCENYG